MSASWPAPETFDPRPHLAPSTRVLIHTGYEFHAKLGSTSDRAAELAKAGAPHGTCVVAFEQTAGRGRRGRQWLSIPGAGLAASFVLRPTFPVRQAPLLTLLTGVAVQEAIQSVAHVQAALKWPNDLLASDGPHGGRKLAGILVELSSDGDCIQHAIAGIGINLREWHRPPEIAGYATSLEALSGAGRISAGAVLAAIADRLEGHLEQLERDGPAAILSAWTAHAFGLGLPVAVEDEGRTQHGQFAGVADDGAIQLRTPTGLVTIHNGQLRLPGVPRPGGR